MVNSSSDPSNINPSQDWGYKFIGNAADDFIREIEGFDALAGYSEYRDRRRHAENLMQDLFGEQPHLFYVSRQGRGRNQNEERWKLITATDRDDIPYPSRLRDLEKKLELKAFVSVDDNLACLRINSVRSLQINQERTDTFIQTFLLRLRSNYRDHIGVTQIAINLMATMPHGQAYIPTEEQLEAWKAYVEIEERKAKERQFRVPFVSHNYGRATKNITFTVNDTSATNGGQINNIQIPDNDFWTRANRARNENVKILDNPNSVGRELGTIRSIDCDRNSITISLDDDLVDDINLGRYSLPQQGIISFEPSGSLAEINRKRRALEQLERGNTQNPYLGQFLFDVSQAREPQRTIEIAQQDLLLLNINPSQKLAVETVLSAPDLALIQGPPGTGKTTVIAEICYQIALRGGRTLIASQANLAVDNALSRFKHNRNIRAVRKGKKNSVGIEGEPFLEDRVVATWLQGTSIDCQQRLDAKRETVSVINRLLASSEQFHIYLTAENNFEPEQQKLQQQRDSYVSEIANQQSVIRSSLHDLQGLFPSVNLEQIEIGVDYDLIYRTIDRCLDEIDRWSSTAKGQLREVLEECLKHCRYANTGSIQLSNSLQILASTSTYRPWDRSLQKNIDRFNELVDLHKRYDQAYTIASEIDMRIRDLKFLSLTPLSEELIFQVTHKLEIDRFDSMTAIERIKQVTNDNIHRLSQPVTIWMSAIDWILDFGYKRKLWQNPSQRATIIATLNAVRRQAPNIVQSFNPANIDTTLISISKDCIKNILDSTHTWLNQTKIGAKNFERYLSQLSQIDTQLSEQIKEIETHRHWWTEYWHSIPARFRPEVFGTNLFDIEFLNRFTSQFNNWNQELQDTQVYLERYENIISDWVSRLTDTSEQHRQELKRIYLDNANVIGITCSQSAQREFAQEFTEFDVVIIDEVSKCTPPELLIPALKAKKLVLVGDHRQLPPMIDNSTIVEIAEELGNTTAELDYLRESLFKSLFESAPESIKTMLSIQYRMHPNIMEAINQFYDDRLECGLDNPDRDRAHHLKNSFVEDDHHIVWVQMPQNNDFRERKEGTSYSNEKEVQAIEKICYQLEQAWGSKVEQGQPRKEVGIITFYLPQLRLIEDIIQHNRFPSLHIRTGTVDRFQGMEKQVIIVSMVRNNDSGNIGFAKSPERVNVAFSRSQQLLIIVGCHSLFTQSSIYSNVSDVVRLNGGLIDVSQFFQ